MSRSHKSRDKRPKFPVVVAECAVRKALRPFLRTRVKSFVAVLVVGESAKHRYYKDAADHVLRSLEPGREWDFDYSAEAFHNADGEAAVLRSLGKVEFLSRTVIVVSSWPENVPDGLQLAVDFVCEVHKPTPDHCRAAGHKLGFHGMSQAAAEFLSLESFDRLATVMRPGRSLRSALARLRETGPSTTVSLDRPDGGVQKSGDAPRPLSELHGYGHVSDWGLELARDLTDWKAGKLDWRDVDAGALLSGPPGCGKTSFAVSLAHSCGMELVATSVGQWQSTGHLGDMLKAMRASFKEAKEKAPCLLFLDEMDSVGRRDVADGNTEYRRQVVNALLECLDGVASREGVVVLGATNFPELVDPAVLRPGRLDVHLEVPLPDREARVAILRQYLGDGGHQLDFGEAAVACEGFSGADLEKVARGARRLARRAGRDVTSRDLDAAMPPTRALNKGERWRVAVHEAGHAVVGVLTGRVLETVTVADRIVIREGAQSLGRTSFTESSPFDSTADHLRADIAMCMGGRVAEEAVFGAFAAGSAGHDSSDLTKATQIAVLIEGVLGMGEGLASDPRWLDAVSNSLAMDFELRRRVERTLAGALQRATEIVSDNKQSVEDVAALLIERKVISGDDVLRVLARNSLAPG